MLVHASELGEFDALFPHTTAHMDLIILLIIPLSGHMIHLTVNFFIDFNPGL